MDKSIIARVVSVAGGRFAPGHLGELTQQVPFEMVDAVLEQTCRVQRRVRNLDVPERPMAARKARHRRPSMRVHNPTCNGRTLRRDVLSE